MTAPARFTQADLRRVLKEVEKTGYDKAKVKITPSGEIELYLSRLADREAYGDDIEL